jgi:hypothetical protein
MNNMVISDGTRDHINAQMREIAIMVGDRQVKVPEKVNEIVLAAIRGHRRLIEETSDQDRAIDYLKDLVEVSTTVRGTGATTTTIELLKLLIDDLEMQPA